MIKLNKILMAAGVAACSLVMFSCNGTDTTVADVLSVSDFKGNLYECKVSNKLIYKTIEIVSDTEVVSTQYKYGGMTAQNFYTFTADESEDQLVLNCYEHDEGATAETSGDADTTITFAAATEEDYAVSITSTYVEQGSPVVSTNNYIIAYPFDTLVGNYYSYTVSGKSITTVYHFISDSQVEVTLTKYGTTATDIVYDYTVTSAHGLKTSSTYDASGSQDINVYDIALTVSEIKANNATAYADASDIAEGDTSTATYTIGSKTLDVTAVATYYGSSGSEETNTYTLVEE